MIFPFIFKYIHNHDNLLFDNLMLLFNREGSFHTESAPMESCRPAIIVSFGVTAHWSPQGFWCSRNRFRGRVSCLMQSRSSRFETLRSAPVLVPQAFLPVFFQGLGDDDFHFLNSFAGP